MINPQLPWRHQLTNPYRPLPVLSVLLIRDEAAQEAISAYLARRASWRDTWALIAKRANALSDVAPLSYVDLIGSTQDLANHYNNTDSERVRKVGWGVVILPALDETDPILFKKMVEKISSMPELQQYIEAAADGCLAVGVWTDAVFTADPTLRRQVLPIDLLYILAAIVEARHATHNEKAP